MIKTSVALVFGEYNHPVQPYLASWAQGLAAHLPVSIFSFSSPKAVPQPGVQFLSTTGRLDKTRRGLSLLSAHPAQTLAWLSSPAAGSLASRLREWVTFGPLVSASPDVIHVVNSYTYPKLQPAITWCKARSIVSFRGYDTVVRPLADVGWKSNLKAIYHSADILHFVSQYLQDEAIKLGAPPEKCRVIYPGVDTGFFTPYEDRTKPFCADRLKLLTTGRLTWQKGYLFMLQAVKRLKSDGVALKYTMVGDGPDREELAYWVRELGLQDSVELQGQKSPEEVRNLLHASDLYVQPSVSEALGVSILEALAAGTPVIASRVGGIPEMVVDGETGRLVAPGDPEALVRVIRELWQDEAQARWLTVNGRTLVENRFSLVDEIQAWIRLYGEL